MTWQQRFIRRITPWPLAIVLMVLGYATDFPRAADALCAGWSTGWRASGSICQPGMPCWRGPSPGRVITRPSTSQPSRSSVPAIVRPYNPPRPGQSEQQTSQAGGVGTSPAASSDSGAEASASASASAGANCPHYPAVQTQLDAHAEQLRDHARKIARLQADIAAMVPIQSADDPPLPPAPGASSESSASASASASAHAVSQAISEAVTEFRAADGERKEQIREVLAKLTDLETRLERLEAQPGETVSNEQLAAELWPYLKGKLGTIELVIERDDGVPHSTQSVKVAEGGKFVVPPMKLRAEESGQVTTGAIGQTFPIIIAPRTGSR